MSHVGQSGSQAHINMDFFYVTIVTIILVKMKVENNAPIIFSHSLVLVCNPVQTWNGIYNQQCLGRFAGGEIEYCRQLHLRFSTVTDLCFNYLRSMYMKVNGK